MKFSIAGYTVEQLSPRGLWLVTSDSSVDVGMLFMRAQEYYESANIGFRGQAFSILDYIHWSCSRKDAENSFTYYNDFEGYNIPGEVCLEVIETDFPDYNKYDRKFASVVSRILAHQGGKFYLIGAKTGDLAVVDHEIAHGLFHLAPAYRTKMYALIGCLPKEAHDAIRSYLEKEGYSESVLEDEMQAYMATGLPVELMQFEPLRPPFMTLFARAKKRLLAQPRKKKHEEEAAKAAEQQQEG